MSLLPPNSTVFEYDIEAVTATIGNVPISIQNLWNPALCEKHFLPWLAWSFSVDHWNSDWNEDVQRDVIANSVKTHSIKGTRGAVENALSSFSVTTEIYEWFEQEPEGQPGTFEIKVMTDGSFQAVQNNVVLGPETIDEIRKSIDNAKRHSQHYDLNIVLTVSSTNYQIGIVSSRQRIDTAFETVMPIFPLESSNKSVGVLNSRSLCEASLRLTFDNVYQLESSLHTVSHINTNNILTFILKAV